MSTNLHPEAQTTASCCPKPLLPFPPLLSSCAHGVLGLGACRGWWVMLGGLLGLPG
jgi:hypothetical protein